MELKLRGFMLDAARLPEPLPYYRQVIDMCAAFGFNATSGVADELARPCLYQHPSC